jgi:cyclopropane fatty-acyl-phospholipid synthase-like methyltransferase
MGTYDKVVSIEMIEAVGHEHLRSYFATINAALKPGGRAVIQVGGQEAAAFCVQPCLLVDG